MYGSEISASATAIGRQSSSTEGRPSGVVSAAPLLALAHDRRGHDVAAAELVDEALAAGVQQHGAVGARRLGDRVPLHRHRPEPAVRVVLQGIEVARLAARAERDVGHLAGRAGGVGRERAEPLGLGIAAPAGREHDRARRDGEAAVLALTERRPPPRRRLVERLERGVVERLDARVRADGLAQRGRDRVPGAIADLQQPLARRAAAARQPVAPVGVVREGDPEALEPVRSRPAPRRSGRPRGEDRPSRASCA